MKYRQAKELESGFTGALRGLWIDSRDRLFAAGDSHVQGGGLRINAAKPAHCVAVAHDGSVFIGEESQLEHFSPQGKLQGSWAVGKATAIGFWKDEVLVADSALRAIQRFDRQGKPLGVIGKDNPVRGFLIPNGVLDFSVDESGIVHAANPGKHRVERYSPDGKLQGHIGRFDQQDAEGFPGCCNPTNVAVSHGLVYVTEKAGPRAKVLDKDGKLQAVIATGAFDPNSKNMPVAVDSHRRVYVADTQRRRILIFEPEAV